MYPKHHAKLKVVHSLQKKLIKKSLKCFSNGTKLTLKRIPQPYNPIRRSTTTIDMLYVMEDHELIKETYFNQQDIKIIELYCPEYIIQYFCFL